LARAGRGGCFDSEPTFRLAELARLRDRDDDALKRLREYFEGGGACAEAYRSLGEILLRKGELAGAEDAFQRAVGADRGFPGAHLGLGRLAATRGDADGAIRALQREIDVDPAAPAPYLEMGLVHERLLSDAAGASVWFARYRGARAGRALTARRSTLLAA
jgi:tetratricopeptide (TPR) repeat protein